MFLNKNFQEILDFLPDPTLAINREGRVIAWNKAIEEMTETPRSLVLGKGDYIYGYAFYRTNRPMLVDLVIQGGKEFEKMYDNIDYQGSSIVGRIYVENFRGEGPAYLWGKAAPIRDEAGNVVGAIESIRDITLQRLTESILQETETKYMALFDSAGDAIFLIKDHKIIDCNKSAEAMFLMPRGKLIGKGIEDLSPEIQSNGETTQKVLRDIISQTGEHNRLPFEMLHARSDGTEFHAEVTLSTFIIGKENFSIAIERDISIRKRIEAENKRLNNELEQKVADRTHELLMANNELLKSNTYLRDTLQELKATQEHLILSEKLAALGQLVAGMAHELNTPLGAISSSNHSIKEIIDRDFSTIAGLLPGLSVQDMTYILGLLQKLGKDQPKMDSEMERQKRKALIRDFSERGIQEPRLLAQALTEIGVFELNEEIERIVSSERCHDILSISNTLISIRKLNGVSLIATEKAAHVVRALRNYLYQERGETSVIDLISEFETILTLFHNQMKFGVEVVMRFDQHAEVEGDRNNLNQVWINLIKNALQAMDYKGTLELEIIRDGNWVTVSVIDSGPGIPEEIRPKLFQPFFTTKEQGHGTGFGLAISKRIAEAQGGEISFESVPGRTRFSVRLKAYRTHETDNRGGLPHG